jgi:hypothetical protein
MPEVELTLVADGTDKPAVAVALATAELFA